MALDPSIILRNIAPQADVGGRLRSGLEAAGIFAKIRQQEEEAPIRQAILQNQSNLLAQQVATGAAEAQEETRKRDLKGLGSSYLQVKGDVSAGNFNAAADQLQAIYDQKIAAGQTPEEMSAHAQAIETLRSNDAEAIKDLKTLGQGVIDAAVAEGLLEDPAAAKVKTTPAAVKELQETFEGNDWQEIRDLSKSDVSFVVNTTDWGLRHYGTDTSFHYLYYKASARLVDLQKLDVTWVASCKYEGEAPRMQRPALDDFLADHGALIKSELKRAADSCVKQLTEQLF